VELVVEFFIKKSRSGGDRRIRTADHLLAKQCVYFYNVAAVIFESLAGKGFARRH